MMEEKFTIIIESEGKSIAAIKEALNEMMNNLDEGSLIGSGHTGDAGYSYVIIEKIEEEDKYGIDS